MIKLPGHYRWSSFCHNVGTRKISFITTHPIYMALGACDQMRRRAYAAFFRYELDEFDVKQIRDAWQTGTRLGNDLFREKVER